MRDLKPELPSQALLKVLCKKPGEITNDGCHFKPLSFRVIGYMAIVNQNNLQIWRLKVKCSGKQNVFSFPLKGSDPRKYGNLNQRTATPQMKMDSDQSVGNSWQGEVCQRDFQRKFWRLPWNDGLQVRVLGFSHFQKLVTVKMRHLLDDLLRFLLGLNSRISYSTYIFQKIGILKL